MSAGLAPSKSTVYVANLPFSLTNNDLHKIFEKHGKVVKVTVVKDKNTRLSKGVAFVLFLDRESAYTAVRAMNNKQMFGRKINCSIAKDNGRASEFIRRKNYTDKSRCYECGEEGHLSYLCPKNALGEREPPKKKPKKKRKLIEDTEDNDDHGSANESDVGEDPALESLGAAIQFQQNLVEEAEYREKVATGNYGDSSRVWADGPASGSSKSRKTIRASHYFSDEDDPSD